MYASHAEKAMSALTALAVVVLIGFALVVGLRPGLGARLPDALVSISLEQPVQPPRKRHRHELKRFKASIVKAPPAPRNIERDATPVVAPIVVPFIVPPPVAAAPKAGNGSAASNGASTLHGPGQGAESSGNGSGGEGVASEAEQIRGRLRFKDLPHGLLQPGQETTVGVRYTVGTDGRVHDCQVSKPSGFPRLDTRTCRLIEKRYRFRPARDDTGRPVPSTIPETQTWAIKTD